MEAYHEILRSEYLTSKVTGCSGESPISRYVLLRSSSLQSSILFEKMPISKVSAFQVENLHLVTFLDYFQKTHTHVNFTKKER